MDADKSFGPTKMPSILVSIIASRFLTPSKVSICIKIDKHLFALTKIIFWFISKI